ncbi:MAG: transcription-repair coupling factor, partial [Ginsengibacter sp.]
MNLDVLMNNYEKDARIFSIADRILLSEPQYIHLAGLHGSSSQFIFSAVFNLPITSQLNHLLILRDAEEAAYFHNTIENITGALDIFYFPSSFKASKNYRQLNSSHVMLRTEALTKISAGGNKKVVVTYPEALCEKVVLSKSLSQNIINLVKGQETNIDGLMEKLVGHGFERNDFVYEPGQFAMRGGILDIYSYGNEKPYRIEFFGNEIESIRIFDPETQLSERKLSEVKIIPNVETQFTTGEKVSLPNFLRENTCVWCSDWSFIKDKMAEEYEAIEKACKQQLSASESTSISDDDELNEKTNLSIN